jgi:Mg/Co/Ni transporter MgtE
VKKAVADDWNICVVLDPNRIVLGLLALDSLKDARGTIEEFMKPAPATLRPGVLIDEASAFLKESNQKLALITKSTGQLIGVIEYQP